MIYVPFKVGIGTALVCSDVEICSFNAKFIRENT